MKICFVISELNERGGTERVATLLANALVKDYSITILSRHCGHSAYPLSEKIKHVELNGKNLSFAQSVKTYLNKFPQDLVVIHTMHKLSLFCLLVGIKAPRVWTIEHISIDYFSKWYQWGRKFLYPKLDRVITLTQRERQRYLKFTSRAITISNPAALEISQYEYQNQSKIILSIGRISNQKGYDMLVQAWQAVEKKHPDWQLHIYGEGGDLDKLNTLKQELKIKNLNFLGTTVDVQTKYDKASFYVMSSRYEGLPMVLIEAMSRGLPIVSFNCPSGPSEIIEDQKTGLLVENGNINALSDAICHLIESPQKRAQMSKTARISAEKYKIQSVVQEYKKYIEELS